MPHTSNFLTCLNRRFTKSLRYCSKYYILAIMLQKFQKKRFSVALLWKYWVSASICTWFTSSNCSDLTPLKTIILTWFKVYHDAGTWNLTLVCYPRLAWHDEKCSIFQSLVTLNLSTFKGGNSGYKAGTGQGTIDSTFNRNYNSLDRLM